MMFLSTYQVCSSLLMLICVTGDNIVNLLNNSSMPTIGSSLTLSCLVQDASNDNNIGWYNPGTINNTAWGLCYRTSALCTGGGHGYTLKANGSGAYISFASVRRDRDEGTWKCIYRDSNGMSHEANLSITVYTLPSQLVYTRDVQAAKDLSVSNASLQCMTVGCTYPRPVIKWYYKDQAVNGVNGVYSMANGLASSGSCQPDEKIYSSTLELPLFTTWSDNTNKSVTFSCRIEYPDSSMNIYSSESGPVWFAVQVSQVELQQNNLPVLDLLPLEVTSGEPETFTCTPGSSRPAPTIEWYIGPDRRSSGTSLTYAFTPVTDDHNKTVYCKAYNFNLQQSIESRKPKLYVRVRVTYVELQQNNLPVPDMSTLTVTFGKSVNMTCIPGTSRPPPTIEWFIGTDKKSTGTSQIFTFTPGTDDHNKMVYCQAYNFDLQQPVESKKPKLYVRVAVMWVSLLVSTSTVVFYEGFPDTLTCTSSPSRPLPTIKWWLSGKQLTDNITTTNTTNTAGLYTLTSQISLTLMKNNTKQQIYCEGFIDDQLGVLSSSKPFTDVLYKPSKPEVRESGGQQSVFIWLENTNGTLQCYSSDYGNPNSSVTWSSHRGVTDSSGLLVIMGLVHTDNGKEVYCELINRFTTEKNEQVLSEKRSLNVEYHPLIEFSAISPLVVNESQSVSVLCEAKGNPNPSPPKWNDLLDGSNLRFDNISRRDTGTYTCEASAISSKYGTLTSRKLLKVTVQCEFVKFCSYIHYSISI